jgi:Tfp pilus assembly protein PilO
VRPPLFRRILREHRRVILPASIGAIVNVAVYAVVVYPLAQRVANIEERNQAAERLLSAARVDHAQAAGTLGGKARATEELATFYTAILPPDLPGARRLTHLRLPHLARRANLRYDRATSKPEQDRDSSLTRLRVDVELTGGYAEIRELIHQLEAEPAFVVIDNLELTERDADDSGTLQVKLQLSTYYRNATP